ncbi:MAG: hypothetical protein WC617_19855 [Rhodanobacter sp.]|jgi:hypothetical protein
MSRGNIVSVEVVVATVISSRMQNISHPKLTPHHHHQTDESREIRDGSEFLQRLWRDPPYVPHVVLVDQLDESIAVGLHRGTRMRCQRAKTNPICAPHNP